MKFRWIPCIALLLLAPFPVLAGDKKADTAPPTLVVRVRSLDAVLDNFKLLASMVGKEEIGRQLEGLIKSKVGPKGLEGIDPARPFGAYGSIGANLNDVVGAVMVPISDEKQVLGLLENLDLKVKKGKDDIYSVAVNEAVNVYFRFANKYAYVTAINSHSLNKDKLIEPATLFPAKAGATIAMSVRIDQIPDIAKQIGKGAIEEKLDELKDKQPGENDAQHKFRLEAQKEFLKIFENVLFNGAELSAEMDIHSKTKEFTATLSLTGKPKSALADDIAKVSSRKSLFGGLKFANPVVNGRLHVVVPESVLKTVESIIKEESKKALGGIGDEGKRKQAQELLKLLSDNFKSGEIDGAIFFNGPGKDKHFNLLFGLKLPEGEKLGKKVTGMVADLLKELPENERKKIQLDADTVGDTKIHKIEVQGNFDAKAQEIFGDNPLYVAFRADGVFVAIGEDGLGSMRKALGTKPAAGLPASLEVNLARLAPLIAKTPAQQAALEKMFSGDDAGTIRLTVNGGEALRLQFTARLSVLQFFTVFGTAKAKKN